MNKIKKFVKSNWPILSYLLIVIILFKQNYVPGTILTGWDNLHPEFDFKTNIGRSIFAVWQEYQGLGLLGGMGHAADLLHQVFLLVLSLFLPENMLRYSWVMLMLFLGSVGTYSLIKKLVFKDKEKISALFSFIGGLFYLLNLSTIQMFYVPFEAFIAHFAALPFLLLTSLNYFQEQTRKNLLILSGVLLLSTPASYIPTLFVVYILALAILLISFSYKNLDKNFLKKGAKLILPIFVVNSFWLLPFLYFTLTNSQVNLESKINQMATEVIYAQNKEFGNIVDVPLLKGFWFNNVDPDKNGIFRYMLSPWRSHFDNFFVNLFGYLLFGVMLSGLYKTFRRKDSLRIPFAILFVFSFVMLCTSTPPFSWADELFRKIPLFFQAFRFPFTKFSILTGLSYSIFLAIGLEFLSGLLAKKVKRAAIVLSGLTILLIFFLSLPAFQGSFFYNKESLQIPKEYYQTFDYFKMQNQNSRIANLPQPTYWGWTFYNWGYGGSGFTWYGIKQPILDRAFDVWSKTDEIYYFELTNAIYSKNTKAFENVLNKYQINFLLLDKNVIYPGAPRSLFYQDLGELISNSKDIKLDKKFGNIEIYKVKLAGSGHDFIYTDSNLPTVNPYSWTSSDQAFSALSNYQDGDNFDYYYPFRSLFTLKTQKQNTVQINESGNFLELKADNTPKTTLNIPSFFEKESLVPIGIILRRDGNNIKVNFKYQTPQIQSGDKNIWEIKDELTLFTLSSIPSKLNINGITDLTIDQKSPTDQILLTTFLTLQEDNMIVLTDKTSGSRTQVVQSQTLKSLVTNQNNLIALPEGKNITVKIPKINDNYLNYEANLKDASVKNCDNFRKGKIDYSLDNNGLKLTSKNATACTGIYKATLTHKQGYAIIVEAKNVKGRPLQFWIENNNEDYAPLDTYLPESQEFAKYFFILPPMEENGSAYTFHFYNSSIGQDESVNYIKRVSVYPIPYSFVLSLNFQDGFFKKQAAAKEVLEVEHPNESLYIVRGVNPSSTLILSQSYDPGWKAYIISNLQLPITKFASTAFPFVFGKEITNHILVNNWENGWNLNLTGDSQEKTVLIVYLPQYLQYLGFMMIGAFAAVILIKHKKL